ncbi:MAG: DUF881 domain-containing protein [Actinomyces sp.]|nr:DUF881 domain-containing protein [Actinomyces sp.]MCI1641152.1 DUF881 domain-containing protein [Actinomyces sp.]MCI1662329.1 DUF881 domain-containing protein [Actinomyces sp.]MCI1691053.1 DUF881 domain-containing protein [Actinomyces sp.]MCI1788688.1 DUF881 domain-containing protein [Actinomyces sp.]MCI1829265.1 DUF881 domain-containing protein [Actinomyces sp.]
MDDASPAPRRPAMWRRVRGALFARPRPLHVVLLVICFVLGAAMVTQVRAQQTDPLETMNQQDLVALLDELSTREETLRSEKSDLQSQLAELQNAASEQQAARSAAERAATQAAVNAGTVPVHGPGLVMTVTDGGGALDSSQFVMALGELRNAGAEAVALNGVRLTPRSWFTSDSTGVVVDGTRISSPYTWQILGDATTLEPALEIQAGSAQQMRARGAGVDIAASDDLQITAVAPAPKPQWATVK